MVSGNRVWRDGLVIGLIGYAAVALFYAAFDVVAARGSLFTVDMLSRALFGTAPDAALMQFPLEPWLAGIFWYNVVHLGASLAIGILVVWLLNFARTHPSRVWLVRGVVAGGYLVTIAVVGMLSQGIRAVLPWWSIVAVNTLAMVVAAEYLRRRRAWLVDAVVGVRHA